MGNQQNSIELNGKLYDPATGLSIAPAKKPVQPHLPSAKRHPSSKAGVIDGFTRRPGVKHAPKSAKRLNKTRVEKSESTAIFNSHAKPQKATTLMRSAVKKPHHAHNDDSAFMSNQKALDRFKRAQSSARSSLIHRFPSSLSKPVAIKHMAAKTAVSTAPKPRPTKHKFVEVSSATLVKSSSDNMVSKAMHGSHSHEAYTPFNKKPKKRLSNRLGFSRKAGNMMAAALAFILLGGFILYQNVPNLSMRIAANRAGFSASLPGYQPAGFSLKGPVQYGPGKITVSFVSNSDNRNFQLTQTVSNWNSQALVDNYMIANNKQYQTFEEQGKTIYIYDSSSATWVNGGVWYNVQGNSSLNSDQLLKIARSI